MAAMRCGVCAINYPLETSTCPVCGEHTDLIKNVSVHEDWEARVRTRLHKEPTLGARIPNSKSGILKVKHTDGYQLFVSHKALLNDGYQHLCDFDVVKIKGEYYELNGFIDGGLEDGYWWISPIVVEEEMNWLTSPGKSGSEQSQTTSEESEADPPGQTPPMSPESS